MSTRRTAARNLPWLFCVLSLFLAASAVRGAEQNLIYFDLIAARLKSMRPHITRLWYGYEYEPEEGKFAPHSEPMLNLVPEGAGRGEPD